MAHKRLANILEQRDKKMNRRDRIEPGKPNSRWKDA